jgi:hypothetical protein
LRATLRIEIVLKSKSQRNSLMRKDKQPETLNPQENAYKGIYWRMGKMKRLKKSFLNGIVCSVGLFLFWLLIGQTISMAFNRQDFSLISYFAFMTLSLSLLSLYVQNKIQRYTSNFSLIKLFSKSSFKKTKSKSSKTVRRKS